MTHVIVVVRGGCVESITTSTPVQVLLMDRDNSSSEIVRGASVTEFTAEVDPDWVAETYRLCWRNAVVSP